MLSECHEQYDEQRVPQSAGRCAGSVSSTVRSSGERPQKQQARRSRSRCFKPHSSAPKWRSAFSDASTELP